MCYVGAIAARALRSWLNARLPARRTSRATRNKSLSWVMRFVSDAPPLVLRLGYIGLRRERFQYGVGVRFPSFGTLLLPAVMFFPPLDVSSDVLKRTGEIAFKIPSGESPFRCPDAT